MKLSLIERNGISILTGSGDVSPHEVQVLRAGLTQILKSGKNRIVLHLPEADKLPGELLREISQLDVLARELAGRIIISGVGAAGREQIARFAQPPVIFCYQSQDEAVEAFLEPFPQTAVLPPTGMESLRLDPEQKKAKEDARQKFRQREMGEIHTVRLAVTKLEAEVAMLQKQLAQALGVRKVPANEAVYQARIKELEQEVVVLKDELTAAREK